jgi:ABC-type multidrug transport system fused ATPase/permease subunit
MSLAKPRQTDYYEITDRGRDLSKTDLLYSMLKEPYYRENKETIHAYLGKKRIEKVGICLAFGYIGVAAVIAAANPNVFSVSVLLRGLLVGSIFVAFVAVLFLMSGRLSNRVLRERQLYAEKAIAVDLLDAYSKYKEKGHEKPEETLKEIAQAMEQTHVPTQWNSVRVEQERIAQIGREVRTRVMPVVGNEKYFTKVEEAMVTLARLLFDDSPESMNRASKSDLFRDFPPATPQSSVPSWKALSGALRSKIVVRYSVAIAVSLAVVGLCIYGGTQYTGITLKPDPLSLVAVVALFFLAATFFERMLARLSGRLSLEEGRPSG